MNESWGVVVYYPVPSSTIQTLTDCKACHRQNEFLSTQCSGRVVFVFPFYANVEKVVKKKTCWDLSTSVQRSFFCPNLIGNCNIERTEIGQQEVNNISLLQPSLKLDRGSQNLHHYLQISTAMETQAMFPLQLILSLTLKEYRKKIIHYTSHSKSTITKSDLSQQKGCLNNTATVSPCENATKGQLLI